MAGGFDSLGLLPGLIRAVDDLGWLLPTDVQDEAIPLILGGGDVMVAAETGSGKTAAFCLPVIQCVYESLSTPDKPTKKKSGGGGGEKEVIVSMNALDRDPTLSIKENGLICESSDPKGWVGARATHGVKEGSSYYFEVTVIGNGICRFGWSSMAAHRELGRDVYGFGYGGTGKKSYSNEFIDYGETFSDSDVIGCFLDFTKDCVGGDGITYTKNGKVMGKAFDLSSSMSGMVLFPAIALKMQKDPISCSMNFGATPFKFPPSSPLAEKYKAMGEASDMLVSSTSKTAFLKEGKRTPLAIILEPSKDLAEQVNQNIEEFVRYLDSPKLKSLLLVGGDNIKEQQKSLKDGVDILVGTTAKISDMIEKKLIDMSQVRFFVLDEADRIVNDSLKDIMDIYRACPSGGSGENRLQVCFFSATLHSPAMSDLSAKICSRPTWVDLKGVNSVPETVHHVAFVINVKNQGLVDSLKTRANVVDDVHTDSPADVSEEGKSLILKKMKQHTLIGILDKFKMSQCMIFCRTNQDCDNLEAFLNGGQKSTVFPGIKESGKESAYSCCVLAGMRSMQDRRAALDAFKQGAVRLLICTDVAARGIDVKGLPYMINMTLPDEAESYIHRVGRVGRSDTMGLAVSIVAEPELKEKVWYHKCANRGKGCQNKKLTDQGGCCIWYDETSCLTQIEERLDTKVSLMSDNYDLPIELTDIGVVYGEAAASEKYVPNYHLLSLAPKVTELSEMEIQAQIVFLDMIEKFAPK